METAIPYLGEICAFFAAVTWAVAVILFKKCGESVHPIALNIFKTILAIILFLPTMFYFGEPLFPKAPISEYVLLMLSGAIGIALADTLFFMCLNLIGASMTAIVECLYSPTIICLSMLWLGERLTLIQIIGALLIISAVLTATTLKGRGTISNRNLFWGIVWGVSGIVCLAVGIIMVKRLLDRSPLLWVTEIRLFGGTIMLLIFLLFHPRRRKIAGSIYSIHSWRYTLAGSFIGTYISMIFWIGGMKFTQTSTAAALNQTSNIFIFIFAAIFLKEAINSQRVIAILLGVVGALLVTFG